MEHQAVGERGIAVEMVADYRVADAQRVGRVDAELVGAAGVRGEFDAGRVPVSLQDLPIAYAEFAVFGVADLSGPIGPVDAEGKFDMA